MFLVKAVKSMLGLSTPYWDRAEQMLLESRSTEDRECYCDGCVYYTDVLVAYYEAMVHEQKVEAANILLTHLPDKVIRSLMVHKLKDEDEGEDDPEIAERTKLVQIMLEVIEFQKKQGLKGWHELAAMFMQQGCYRYSSEFKIQDALIFNIAQNYFLAIDAAMAETNVSIELFPTVVNEFKDPNNLKGAVQPLYIQINGYNRVNPAFQQMLERLNDGRKAEPTPELIAQAKATIK